MVVSMIGLALTFQSTYDAGDHPVDALRFDRTLAQGYADRSFQLVTVEVLPSAIGLDDHQIAQLHPLVGGEAPAAGRAEPAAPDRHVILGGSGILDLRFDTSTIRTAHRFILVFGSHMSEISIWGAKGFG